MPTAEPAASIACLESYSFWDVVDEAIQPRCGIRNHRHFPAQAARMQDCPCSHAATLHDIWSFAKHAEPEA